MTWRSYLLALCGLSLAAPAHGQIFSWHDGNGRLVLSDRPMGAVERIYAVPQAETVRATRPGVVAQSRLYEDLIVEHARRHDVRADLVRAVMQVESGFNPFARSRKGALGLMQLMPATSEQFGVMNPFNPLENIRAGVAYLRQLLDRYGNDERLALAAYNAGPGAVDRYGQSVPPYRETRAYVDRVNRVARASERPSSVIYKTLDIVDGRPVARYSNRKPSSGPYEVVGRR